MPPGKKLNSNKSMVVQTVIPVEAETENAEEAIDSNEMTYFVDEEGRYYYQAGSESGLVPLTATDESGTMQEQTQDEEEYSSQDAATVNTEDYQTVTLVPSENSNGEISYVLVVQDKSQPLVDIHIKEEPPASDVYKFDDEDVEHEIQDEEPISVKQKRKGKVRPLFTCSFCHYSSQRRYLLIRHMKIHSEERPHKCDVCDRGFKTFASLQNHTNMHNGIKPHQCKYCESTFTTSGELIRHTRYKHTLEKPHKCSDCDYASVELSKLKRHIRCHTGERPYQCPHCTYASPDTFKLKRHLRTHTGEKPYKCDICEMCFTQSNSLKSHKLIHNLVDKPVYACELCPARCGRKTDLRMHLQKMHTLTVPLKCQRCGKTFTDRYTYKMHIKTHEGERCFTCEICPYATAHRRHLESHMLKHTDEKPFACDECTLTFRQKQLLRRHKNLYHNPDYVPMPPKVKSHSCHNCERTFAHKGNLIRHLAVHDPDSGHQEQALALKLGRQKRVKYVDAQTLKVIQNGGNSKTKPVKHDVNSKRKSSEVVTVSTGDRQQYVVLEVIQLEDGTEQHVAVMAPDFVSVAGKGGDNMLFEDEDDSQGGQQLEMEVDMTDEEEEEEKEEEMKSILQQHIQKQNKGEEQSIKLEKELDSCFGFVEDETENDEIFEENVIYELT